MVNLNLRKKLHSDKAKLEELFKSHGIIHTVEVEPRELYDLIPYWYLKVGYVDYNKYLMSECVFRIGVGGEFTGYEFYGKPLKDLVGYYTKRIQEMENVDDYWSRKESLGYLLGVLGRKFRINSTTNEFKDSSVGDVNDGIHYKYSIYPNDDGGFNVGKDVYTTWVSKVSVYKLDVYTINSIEDVVALRDDYIRELEYIITSHKYTVGIKRKADDVLTKLIGGYIGDN